MKLKLDLDDFRVPDGKPFRITGTTPTSPLVNPRAAKSCTKNRPAAGAVITPST